MSNDWTTTCAPRVPDRSTSRRAVARSGRPEAVPEAVNGQYGRKPAKPGGRSWQVGAREGPAAERAGRPPAIERERHRPSGVHVVERSDPGVQREPGGDRRRRVAQELGRATANVGNLRREPLDGIVEEVELPRADPLRRSPHGDAEAHDHGVGITVGPHRGRPRPERWVALQPHLAPLVEAHDAVRPGRGQRPPGRDLHSHARRQQEREGHRELVEQVAVGHGQVEDDRARLVVGHDPAGQVARPGAAGTRPADRAEELVRESSVADPPFDGETDVARPHRLAGRVADPAPEPEGVRAAAVRRDGQGLGQAGRQRRGYRPGGCIRSARRW